MPRRVDLNLGLQTLSTDENMYVRPLQYTANYELQQRAQTNRQSGKRLSGKRLNTGRRYVRGIRIYAALMTDDRPLMEGGGLPGLGGG